MRAMVFRKAGEPLRLEHIARPDPGPWDVLIRVEACGVCRTDLHIADGDLTEAAVPLIPGHEVVGRIVAAGSKVEGLETGQRVGVPWLGATCRRCRYCWKAQENLCDAPVFTGYTRNGGFAEFCLADGRYVFRLDGDAGPVQLAPLLCAGLIGYRSYRMAGEAASLGLYGFGAAAHILTQLAVWQGRKVFALTRPGDTAAQEFARSLGAVWAGGSDERPLEALDAAILFAPVGGLVPVALKAVRKGGRVVCGGIHMSDIPGFPYADLWGERHILSVANLTRQDGEEFLPLAAEAGIATQGRRYALEEANQALADMRQGRLQGAAVLVP
ncbi:zinc-dependent alcohol dehydrogenase family protein [Leisingera aquaemixtae]|uniref:zinc-dependent alcohol dehydrogenase family protein n=1 Tax=Leisingera aquaemixtae TaxID=1396826 RepID=UPI001C95272B|nr:zinc-dependent alcohol dehydrogenase family protein [Leisingera aquaemixtae]MBY6068842.1 zinc-dependent alcohol dehydrogenase family protein [Leisingera aquaemixtae]